MIHFSVVNGRIFINGEEATDEQGKAALATLPSLRELPTEARRPLCREHGDLFLALIALSRRRRIEAAQADEPDLRALRMETVYGIEEAMDVVVSLLMTLDVRPHEAGS